jgi:hypothetical protein
MEINWRLVEGDAPHTLLMDFGVGFQVFESMFDAPSGHLPLPQPGERYAGRHYARLTGWDDDDLAFQKGWHPWGDRGYGHMSRSYFESYADHSQIVRSVVAGRAFVAAWTRPTEAHVEDAEHRGQPYFKVRYAVLSLGRDCFGEVIGFRGRDQRRIAWAHLLHPRGEDSSRSVVTEFFVAPQARTWMTSLSVTPYPGSSRTTTRTSTPVALDIGALRVRRRTSATVTQSVEESLSPLSLWAVAVGFVQLDMNLRRFNFCALRHDQILERPTPAPSPLFLWGLTQDD